MTVTQLECGCRAATDEGYPRSGELCGEASGLWLAHTRAVLRGDVAAAKEAWARINEHWDKR